MKVGLAWRGNPKHVNDRRRSIPTDALAPFGKIDVEWFSLQKPTASPGFAVHDLTAQLTDFTETAALISQLDLVIAADTSVAHLAGALGKPTWLLLPVVSDWRWLLDREDSPWYPTMRLLRQKTNGDWNEVVTRIAEELKRLTC
jgi:ADP-heptose:LPS heptosyltransferase